MTIISRKSGKMLCIVPSTNQIVYGEASWSETGSWDVFRGMGTEITMPCVRTILLVVLEGTGKATGVPSRKGSQVVAGEVEL
jgi:hypothetical protein